MNARKVVLLVVALIIAGGTMMLARSMLSTPGQPGDKSGVSARVEAPVSVEVSVAARDLPAGTILKDTDFKWQVWPKEGATEAFIVKEKKDAKEFIGAVVRQGIRTGEPILVSKIVSSKEQGFLAAALAPGMRAITIPITPASGVAGFAFPGDSVDVVVTHKIIRRSVDGNSQTERRVSETMLSDVRVLALDQRTDDQAKDAKPAQLATLEVTSKEAEQLALVNDIGVLSLVLRSIAADPQQPSDSGVVIEEKGMTWDSDVSQALRKGQLRRVQIMRGKETTETVFDNQSQ
ncbi:MAG: Flp pilus assembly protein CpaB [Alphaproteobacteria bacterium]|nr:Flp pilus assembly protein CpaB [Alphaproteobacteria bacterium]